MTQIGEAERIVKLMLFVRAHGPVSLSEIRLQLPYEYGEPAGSEASTRRRFERDKKTLSEYGIFLQVDSRQRYSIDDERTFSAPVSLTPAQVSMLRLVCGALLEDDSYPFKEELRMALVKLGGELEIPDMLPQASEGAFRLDRSSEPQGFSKIRKAMVSRKRLTFDYEGASGKSSSREVEPFGCFFLKQNCYVVAYDLVAEDVRCFRIDRMSKIRVNAANLNTPDFHERPFDAADHYGLPFQFGDESYEALVRFSASAVPRAHELAMGQGRLEPDGDCLLWSVTCRDTDMLAQWCVENSPGLEIVEPPEAEEALRRRLATFLEALEGSACEG